MNLPNVTDGALIHASAVSVADRAALVLGASGTGKSALCLQLIALGAGLIADDRCRITLRDGWPVVSAPDQLRGLVEARGVGLLHVPPARPAPVALIVDLGQTETDRLPPDRHGTLLGASIPLLHRAEGLHFAPAVLLLLQGGRIP